MGIAALITWILTAAGGFFLLATWIAKGGARGGRPGSTRFPPAVIFGASWPATYCGGRRRRRRMSRVPRNFGGGPLIVRPR